MTILDKQSYVYLDTLSVTSTGDWDNVKDAAIANLRTALFTGTDMDPEAVHFLMDYYNDGWDGDRLDNGLVNLLYHDYNGNGTSDSGGWAYYNATGAPLTEALAPLMCDPFFAPSPAQFYSTLRTALINTNATTPKSAPPALAIKTLGGSNLEFPVGMKDSDRAKEYAEQWIFYAASNNIRIDSALIDAFVDLDRAAALTFIQGQIATLAPSGSASDSAGRLQLMDVYRSLNPKGPGGPGPTTLNFTGTPFTGPSPTVSGWASLAVTSLTRSASLGKPLDATMLQQLEDIDPTAAAFCRWTALSAQTASGTLNSGLLSALQAFSPAAASSVCQTVLQAQVTAGKALSTDYLKVVAAYDPQVAITLCNDSFESGIKPTNKLLNNGVPDTDNTTTSLRPTFRIDLKGMGIPQPTVGTNVSTTVYLYVDGNTSAFATVGLSAADIAAGYVDIAPNPNLGNNSLHTIQSKFQTTVQSPYSATESPFSTPLIIGIGTPPTAPPLPLPARSLDLKALDVLKTIDPAGAESWRARYAALGLTTATASSDSGTDAPLDVSTLDLETALWMVFTGRATEVESQLKQQIAITQQKNEAMGKLNELLGVMNKLAAAVPASAKATDSVSGQVGSKYSALASEVNTAITNAGVKPFSTPTGTIATTSTKGDLEGAIQQLKGQIDSLGNNQQTEMLRLQSLTTKRNECYDILTNHMQKVSSVRDKIIENTR